MSSHDTFSEAKLKSIRERFHATAATPEELGLLLRPCSTSRHMTRMGFHCFAGMILAVGPLAECVWASEADIRAVLMPAYQRTLLLLAALLAFIFFVLPRLYRPRFPVFLRSGENTVTLKMFGFEQDRPASCCGVSVRRFGCYVSIDSIEYEIARRWWQKCLPPMPAAQHIADLFFQVSQGGRGIAESSDTPAGLPFGAVRRLLTKAYQEAVVTPHEIVVLLPTAGWHAWLHGLHSYLAFIAVGVWQTFHPPVPTDLAGFVEPEMVARRLSEMPLWLPATVMLLLIGALSTWADPWFRRSIGVVPRGQGRIRIRHGRRYVTDLPLTADVNYIYDPREENALREYLGLDRGAWAALRTGCWDAHGSGNPDYMMMEWAAPDRSPTGRA